jgi:hypothetical protein
MSKSNQWESDLLKLLFQNIAATDIGDAGGLLPSETEGNLYISLHTADPGEGGDQTTNEADYGSYARVAVTRSNTSWTVSGSNPTQVTNATTIMFPTCTSGDNTVTHFGIGTDSTGPGKLLYIGTLSSSLMISATMTPLFNAENLVVTEE